VNLAGEGDEGRDMGGGAPDVGWAGGGGLLDEEFNGVALVVLVDLVGLLERVRRVSVALVLLVTDFVDHGGHVDRRRVDIVEFLAVVLRAPESVGFHHNALNVLVVVGCVVVGAVHVRADGHVDSLEPRAILIRNLELVDEEEARVALIVAALRVVREEVLSQQVP
jgi:hypothetical protein